MNTKNTSVTHDIDIMFAADKQPGKRFIYLESSDRDFLIQNFEQLQELNVFDALTDFLACNDGMSTHLSYFLDQDKTFLFENWEQINELFSRRVIRKFIKNISETRRTGRNFDGTFKKYNAILQGLQKRYSKEAEMNSIQDEETKIQQSVLQVLTRNDRHFLDTRKQFLETQFGKNIVAQFREQLWFKRGVLNENTHLSERDYLTLIAQIAIDVKKNIVEATQDTQPSEIQLNKYELFDDILMNRLLLTESDISSLNDQDKDIILSTPHFTWLQNNSVPLPKNYEVIVGKAIIGYISYKTVCSHLSQKELKNKYLDIYGAVERVESKRVQDVENSFTQQTSVFPRKQNTYRKSNRFRWLKNRFKQLVDGLIFMKPQTV